ncbi:PAS domain S-box protein [Halorientalis salina]|uniref:PAS domain S-box protein n=1 Tax=Halorientalis salina TaxID=2932266 RepID=UPI0010ACA955|nr:PAS domain S-box protein [Halorientalis salina]
MNGPDDGALPGDTSPATRVRLLVDDDRNRELLADWLSESYEVGVGTGDDPFDMCIVDPASFVRHREWLVDHKERTHPVFVPVVLVSREPPSERLDPADWTDIDGLYVIDEIVSVPVEKSVLYRRLENLLERRRLSQRLAGRLEQSQERFRTLFDATPDPVLVLSAAHEIQYVNDAFCERFETDRDPVLETRLESLTSFSSSTAETIGDQVDRQLDGQAVETTEISYETPDGSRRYAEIKISTLEAPASDDAVVIMRDVTDRRWFENTLQSLHAASRALFDATGETEVSQRIVETATDRLGLSGVAVYLQSEPDGPLEPVAQSLDETAVGTPLPTVPADDSNSIGQAFESGGAVHFDDIRTSPGFEETELRAGVSVPVGDHGVIVVGSTAVGPFDDRTGTLVTLLADSARTALDRIERERELSESEQRFRQIADSVHEIIWMADATGEELLYLSPGFEEVTGRTKAEFGDELWAYVDTAHPDDRTELRAWLSTVFDHEDCDDSYHIEYRIRRPDGEVRWVEADAYPVREPDGTVQKVVGLIDDITDLKRREQELEAKNERLDQFASLVSHDLRNPLQVALSRIEAARETGDLDEHLGAAEGSLHRMNRLIEDVLAFAKQGQTTPNLELISLDAVARRAWDSVDHETATLRVDADEIIKADHDRLLQIFENLYRNSVEHGGPEVTVRVGLLDGGGGFYVEDDGPGIPESERDHVFEMGYSNESDGTGFGLAMVEEIATAHGWAVTVTEAGGVPASDASGESADERRESGGARFEFTEVYS